MHHRFMSLILHLFTLALLLSSAQSQQPFAVPPNLDVPALALATPVPAMTEVLPKGAISTSTPPELPPGDLLQSDTSPPLETESIMSETLSTDQSSAETPIIPQFPDLNSTQEASIASSTGNSSMSTSGSSSNQSSSHVPDVGSPDLSSLPDGETGSGSSSNLTDISSSSRSEDTDDSKENSTSLASDAVDSSSSSRSGGTSGSTEKSESLASDGVDPSFSGSSIDTSDPPEEPDSRMSDKIDPSSATRSDDASHSTDKSSSSASDKLDPSSSDDSQDRSNSTDKPANSASDKVDSSSRDDVKDKSDAIENSGSSASNADAVGLSSSYDSMAGSIGNSSESRTDTESSSSDSSKVDGIVERSRQDIDDDLDVIALIVFAGLAVLCGIGLIAFCCCRRKRKRDKRTDDRELTDMPLTPMETHGSCSNETTGAWMGTPQTFGESRANRCRSNGSETVATIDTGTTVPPSVWEEGRMSSDRFGQEQSTMYVEGYGAQWKHLSTITEASYKSPGRFESQSQSSIRADGSISRDSSRPSFNSELDSPSSSSNFSFSCHSDSMESIARVYAIDSPNNLSPASLSSRISDISQDSSLHYMPSARGSMLSSIHSNLSTRTVEAPQSQDAAVSPRNGLEISDGKEEGSDRDWFRRNAERDAAEAHAQKSALNRISYEL